MPKGSYLLGQSPRANEACSSTDHFRRGPGGATRQATELRREGVTVGTGHLGELMVDFGTYGWFPEMLPSEADELSESDEGESS